MEAAEPGRVNLHSLPAFFESYVQVIEDSWAAHSLAPTRNIVFGVGYLQTGKVIEGLSRLTIWPMNARRETPAQLQSLQSLDKTARSRNVVSIRVEVKFSYRLACCSQLQSRQSHCNGASSSLNFSWTELSTCYVAYFPLRQKGTVNNVGVYDTPPQDNRRKRRAWTQPR